MLRDSAVMSNTFKEKLEDIITEIPANLPGQFSLYGHIFFFFCTWQQQL
jgi:hypothetical protein